MEIRINLLNILNLRVATIKLKERFKQNQMKFNEDINYITDEFNFDRPKDKSVRNVLTEIIANSESQGVACFTINDKRKYWFCKTENLKLVLVDESNNSVDYYDEEGYLSFEGLVKNYNIITFKGIRLHKSDKLNIDSSDKQSKLKEEDLDKYDSSFIFKLVKILINWSAGRGKIVIKNKTNVDLDLLAQIVDLLSLKEKKINEEWGSYWVSSVLFLNNEYQKYFKIFTEYLPDVKISQPKETILKF